MSKVRCFISFDYDNDSALKDFLVGQAKNEDSPFEISDWSIKSASSTWKQEARDRIRQSSQVIVICGNHTDTANGVSIELTIAQEENKPYFLLKGYPDSVCKKPKSAKDNDKMYRWTWENLKILINGGR